MTDFLVGIGVLLVIEGLLLAGFTRWTRSAMASAITAPDTLLRRVGISSALVGLLVIWLLRG
jgi:uncharacterized protein YjeT (DUF2065 family)